MSRSRQQTRWGGHTPTPNVLGLAGNIDQLTRLYSLEFLFAFLLFLDLPFVPVFAEFEFSVAGAAASPEGAFLLFLDLPFVPVFAEFEFPAAGAAASPEGAAVLAAEGRRRCGFLGSAAGVSAGTALFRSASAD